MSEHTTATAEQAAAGEAVPGGVRSRDGGEMAMALLLEAGAVLASSLDPDTTMGQVAQLTVPELADLCVVDLLAEDGSIREVAVVGRDEQVAAGLDRMRAEHPVDPAGAHPVARVIRGGEPLLLSRMSSGQLTEFAQGSEHARFMIEHDYRSAIVAPLVARERTLGALSVLRLGAGEPYDEAELDLVCELARRAALAIDNARLYSDLRRTEQRLQAVLVNLAEAITVVDEQGQTVFANQAAADLFGVETPAELIEAPPGAILARFVAFDEEGRRLNLEAMPGRRLFAGRPAEPLLVRNIVPETKQERWIVVRTSAIADPDSGRTLYAVNVFEDITEVKRVQVAESFMSEASRVLASSLDYRSTLRRVAKLAVPQIASWCAMDLLGEDGEIERVVVHHDDPETLALAREIDRDYRPSMDDAGGVAEVIRSGRSLFYSDVSPQALEEYARDERHLQLLRRIDASAVIVAPMIGATGAVGAVTLASSGLSRRLTAADVPLAERLARRSGTAVEKARLEAGRARIAHTLQQALLPDSLPEVEGAEVCARYRASGELNEVGGDFYDVFSREDGTWTLVIGDVCGKGPRAASVTALARYTLRAASMSGHSFTQMLEMLHRALRPQPAGGDLCTVCLVGFERSGDGARLRVALAGHPPPLVLGADGSARQVGEPGTVLGVLDPIYVRESEAELAPGETLLLYTDGAPEARHEGEQLGERGLIELCRRAPGNGLDSLLDHVEQCVLEHAGGTLRDDLALLALRLRRPAGQER